MTRWFFPAFMIAIGAHYLPFAVLYGIRASWYIGAFMWLGGFMIGMLAPESAVVAAWFTGVLLIFFSISDARKFRLTHDLTNGQTGLGT